MEHCLGCQIYKRIFYNFCFTDLFQDPSLGLTFSIQHDSCIFSLKNDIIFAFIEAINNSADFLFVYPE